MAAARNTRAWWIAGRLAACAIVVSCPCAGTAAEIAPPLVPIRMHPIGAEIAPGPPRSLGPVAPLPPLVPIVATAAPVPSAPARAALGGPPLAPIQGVPAAVGPIGSLAVRDPVVPPGAGGSRVPAAGLAPISYAPLPVVPPPPADSLATLPLPPPAIPAAANVVPLPAATDLVRDASVLPPLPPLPSMAAPVTMQPPLPSSPVIPPAPSATAALPPPPAAAPANLAPPPLQEPAAARSLPPPAAPAAAPESPRPVAAGKPADAILVGSFNIQVFGESKIAKHEVVDVLARVVRGLDVVAIQEVRAKSDGVIPQFVSAINADGSRYQYVIGPRLGRTVSKEQYCFIYDSTRIEVDPSSVGTVPNPGDRLHRPPLHARFRVRANPPEAGFSFWMIDTHTDPDEVPQEVDALADVFAYVKALRPDEDDVILLGDLNAGPPQFGKIKRIPGVGWAVSGVTTNTRRTKTYDNIIFDRGATTEYTGRWGVLDLQDTFGLPLAKALEVSDHNPVWAAFSPWEARPAAATASAPGLTVGR